MSEGTIRLATPGDIDALLALEREAPAAAHWSRAQYEAIFQSGALPRLSLVAEKGPLQAFLAAQTAAPEWELENIVVAPGARRRGLGMALVQKLADEARQRGAGAILLEVRASNLAARALYQNCGFVEAGRRLRYYQNPEEDAVICKLDITKS